MLFRIARETRWQGAVAGAVLAGVLAAGGCGGGRPSTADRAAPGTGAPSTPGGHPGSGPGAGSGSAAADPAEAPVAVVPLTVSADGRTAHSVEADDDGLTLTVLINHPDDTSWADALRAALAALAARSPALAGTPAEPAPAGDTADVDLGVADLRALLGAAGVPDDGLAVTYEDVPGGGRVHAAPQGPRGEGLRRWLAARRHPGVPGPEGDAARL